LISRTMLQTVMHEVLWRRHEIRREAVKEITLQIFYP